jgi:hypothetical protein
MINNNKLLRGAGHHRQPPIILLQNLQLITTCSVRTHSSDVKKILDYTPNVPSSVVLTQNLEKNNIPEIPIPTKLAISISPSLHSLATCRSLSFEKKSSPLARQEGSRSGPLALENGGLERLT